MLAAPILLFVYNRPFHTKKTLDHLRANTLAGESDLYIFSDGPKNAEATPHVEAVRELVRSTSGFKSVNIVEASINKGLARSIIDGVNHLTQTHDFVIILEDDIITSPLFLSYMNHARNFYAKNEQVMHVSGYMYDIDKNELPETFFLCQATCWGWGTWARAWKHFEKNPQKYAAIIKGKKRRQFNLQNSYNFYRQIEENLAGRINTWAIFWYASIFHHNGLSLHPKFSLCQNIGHDGTGVHCDKTSHFQVSLATEMPRSFSNQLAIDPEAEKALINFFLSIKPTLIFRIKNKVRKLQGRYFNSSL